MTYNTTVSILFSIASFVHFTISILLLFWSSVARINVLVAFFVGCVFLPSALLLIKQPTHLQKIFVWIGACICAFGGGILLSLTSNRVDSMYMMGSLIHGFIAPHFVIGLWWYLRR